MNGHVNSPISNKFNKHIMNCHTVSINQSTGQEYRGKGKKKQFDLGIKLEDGIIINFGLATLIKV